jgi:cell division septum initiation protein DivIVA
MTTRQSESDERFDAARVKQARADLEETVQGLRQRGEPSAFAVKHAPQEVENIREYQHREARRIADERAGRPTKPFAEMEGLEIFLAMASYAGPGHYPHDLEAIAQEMAERPVPTLTASDEEALGEVIGIRQRVEAGEREAWMVDRLSELSQHATDSVRVAAMGLRFQLVEEARSERDDEPEPQTQQD